MLSRMGSPYCEGHCGPGVCSKNCYKSVLHGPVCWTCQLWKLAGTPWNFASYINSGMVWPSCLTLLLTRDIISHILQGLTVTPFKFHLLVPQAISTLSFVKPPGYGTNYRLRSSHLHLLPPLREHLCFITLNNTYASLLYFSFFWGVGGGVRDLY